jgi:hypothetical protein
LQQEEFVKNSDGITLRDGRRQGARGKVEGWRLEVGGLRFEV